jgi:hypothetical protein
MKWRNLWRWQSRPVTPYRTSAPSHAPYLVQFLAMTNLTSAVKQLEQERTRLASQLEHLTNAISVLNGTSTSRIGRTLSASARARIAAAQRARWAKAKEVKVVSIASNKRRKLSSAAIARIRAAQKARWAKWRKQKRTA